MAKVIDCIGGEVTLLKLKRVSDVVEERKDFAIVFNVLFGCLAEDIDVAF